VSTGTSTRGATQCRASSANSTDSSAASRAPASSNQPSATAHLPGLPPASVLVSSRLRLCVFHAPRLALEPASLDVQILDIPVSCSHSYGSPITDVHTEGGVMSKVDVGSGYLSYIGRPQTLPFWITIATFCCPATWLRNGPKSPPFYCTTNLVLHSNFDIYMFYLLIHC